MKAALIGTEAPTTSPEIRADEVWRHVRSQGFLNQAKKHLAEGIFLVGAAVYTAAEAREVRAILIATGLMLGVVAVGFVRAFVGAKSTMLGDRLRSANSTIDHLTAKVTEYERPLNIHIVDMDMGMSWAQVRDDYPMVVTFNTFTVTNRSSLHSVNLIFILTIPFVDSENVLVLDSRRHNGPKAHPYTGGEYLPERIDLEPEESRSGILRFSTTQLKYGIDGLEKLNDWKATLDVYDLVSHKHVTFEREKHMRQMTIPPSGGFILLPKDSP